MSTKTTLKRISLVAVAAMGFGMLTVVAANATVPSDVTSMSLAQVTSTPSLNSAVDVNMGAVLPADVTGSMTFVGALTSYPAGGYVSVNAVATPTNGTTSLGDSDTVTAGALVVTNPKTAKGKTASSTAGNGTFRFTPTVAGAYTLTVWNDANTPDGAIGATEVRQTINITVGAPNAFSAGTSSAYLIAGNGTTQGDATSDANGATASKTMTTANAAAITVKLNDSSNVAMASGNTLSATISGSGGLAGSNSDNPVANQCSASTISRSVTVSNTDAVNTLYVCADGTAGTGTVTISVTNSAGATVVLATKTVTFFGSIATLTLSSQPFSILRAGGHTTGVTTGITSAGTLSTTPAVVLVAKDSAGNLVGNLSISSVSSNTAVIASSTVAEDNATNDADGNYGGPGYYVAAVTSATSSLSGQSATVTYRIVNPADSTAYISVVVPFTVGGSVSKETLTMDATSYAPGAPMVITRTAVDAAGNPVYDGAAAPAVTANKSLGGTTPGASIYIGGKKVTGASTVFAPATSGDFMIQMTSGNATADVITATATVTGGSNADVQAAIDAANAATDAANYAADAADAATTAAQEATAAAQAAQDSADAATAAVVALGLRVNVLMASVRAQLTSLSNLLVRIIKKTHA